MTANNGNSRNSRYTELLDAYFAADETRLLDSYSGIAKKLNIKDYTTVKKHITKRYTPEELDIIREQAIQNQINFVNTSESTTSTQDYPNKVPYQRPILTFTEYCQKYHIPEAQVTSSKFVNHTGQQAWNVVCDYTKISETHLNEYFDRLKTELSAVIEPVKLYQHEVSTEVAYCFWFSDKHVGARTIDKSMYGNEYNAEVFRQRMLAALDDFQIEAKLHGRFDKVFIGDLGDALDGWDQKTTRPGSSHILPQNLTNRESFDVYSRVTQEFMDKLISLNLANQYEFVSVTNDNHSSDFGYICNRAVEIWLNVKYPEVKTRILDKFIEHVKYGIHTIMLCHGKDSEHRRSGMPLNLDTATEKYINTHIDILQLTGVLHFIKGDLHQAATNYARKFRYRNVLSLYGSSDWAQTNFEPTLAGISTDIIYKNINKVLPGEQFFQLI